MRLLQKTLEMEYQQSVENVTMQKDKINIVVKCMDIGKYLNMQGINSKSAYVQNGYLSNWYHSKFTINNITFDSGEQYMMYMKAITFNDLEIANKIMQTTDFAEIKSFGRSVKGFKDKKWDAIKEEIMFKGLLQKFSQNDDLKQMLLATNNALLAECAVKDTIWGIGLSMKDKDRFNKNKWKGQNLLGKTLMRVRSTLSNN